MPSRRLILLAVVSVFGLGGPLGAQTTGNADAGDIFYPSERNQVADADRGAVDLGLWVQIIAILALGGAGAWLIAAKKGVNPFAKLQGQSGGGTLKILETRPLGQRQYLMVVSADGKRLLLAAGPQGVRLLKELDEPDFGDAFGSESPEDAQ
ncbi:MAG: hypothetical protein E1N59_91 [Puniceicoccaceae bacterium 5H]|nr:MAG: hypothetical protein E1N59_91 [Puniceicoccaceae bacterium 5H]